MCSPFRAIGKVFKKVLKAIRKVAPIALAIGAVVFTVGGAMGVGSMAGGWGGAVGKLTSTLGLNSTLGNIVTGAITQAGYGAALGGGLSAMTGGDFATGAERGALVGGVTGGVTGGFSPENIDPLRGFTTPDASTAPGAAPAAATAPGTSTGLLPAAPAAPGAAPTAAVPVPTAPVAGTTPAAAPSWLSEHQTLVGGALAGIGQGLVSGMAAGDEAEADRETMGMKISAEEKEQQRRTAGYGGETGLLTGGTAANVAAGGAVQPTPSEKYDQLAGHEYYYDVADGRMKTRPKQVLA